MPSPLSSSRRSWALAIPWWRHNRGWPSRPPSPSGSRNEGWAGSGVSLKCRIKKCHWTSLVRKRMFSREGSVRPSVKKVRSHKFPISRFISSLSLCLSHFTMLIFHAELLISMAIKAFSFKAGKVIHAGMSRKCARGNLSICIIMFPRLLLSNW